MPNYFSDAPTTLDRRTARSANAQTRKRERIVAKIKAGKGRPSRSSGPPKKNTERQKRMTVIRRQKHQAYRRSECYKAVEKRSGGRCERMLPGTFQMFGGGVCVGVDYRCPNSRAGGFRMTHNHKTYARYGGKELPGDIELLCPTCNAAYESSKRGRRSFRARLGEEGT